MTDITPEERLTATMSQPRTDALFEDADGLMLYAEALRSGLDAEDQLIQRIYHNQDLAHIRVRQAQVEQQRIANLLTVALDSHSGVGSPRFNLAAREQARDMALEALGLPKGGWER